MRTHFERLFRDYAVRGRSGLVAAWLHDRSAPFPERPLDECPYSRPFPEAFADCPAYQAIEMVTLDIGYRPLGRVWSCRHLHPKRHAVDQRWYAACLVGDAEGRRLWAQAVGTERLGKIELLRQALAEVAGPSLEPIWRHKRRQLELIAAGDDPEPETNWLQTATRQLAARIDALLRQHAAMLDEIHLPQDACTNLIREALNRLVMQESVDFQLEVPDEVLDRFPSDMRSFFRPRALAD